jgi:hypothetical protein
VTCARCGNEFNRMTAEFCNWCGHDLGQPAAGTVPGPSGSNQAGAPSCPRCSNSQVRGNYCDLCGTSLPVTVPHTELAATLAGPSDSSPEGRRAFLESLDGPSRERSGGGWISELVEAERLAGVASEETFQARRDLEAAEADAPGEWVTDMTPAERSRYVAMHNARARVQAAEIAERTAQSRYARKLAAYDAAMEPPGRPIGDDDDFAFIDQPRSGLRQLHYRPEGLRDR